LAGLGMIAVLLFLANVVDRVPVPSLAGLVIVVAWGLIDVGRIREIARSSWSDRIAFAATLVATWVVSLDDAIYIGVLLSIVLFLRRARMLHVEDLRLVDGRLQEDVAGRGFMSRGIRVLHVEGALFFAS